jgi:uncharacterized protein (TIGR00369 family)
MLQLLQMWTDRFIGRMGFHDRLRRTLDAGVSYSTLELKVNYIRAVPTDGRRLTATGTTIHVGRTTATAEGRVVDDQGRLVAHATTTCVIFR